MSTRHALLKSVPNVAVILPTAVINSRKIRSGVLRYVRLNGPWNVQLVDDRPGETSSRLDPLVTLDGLIGFLTRPAEIREISRMKIPMVLIDPERSDLPAGLQNLLARTSTIRCDTEAVGRKAAEFLWDEGFRNFAYVNEAEMRGWSVRRGEAFRQALRAKGTDCAVYGAENPPLPRDTARLTAFVRRLPKPVCIFTAWDVRARQIVNICQGLKLRIPSDVALLGVDNDCDLCESVVPGISSVDLDSERAAFVGSRLLDRLMRGESSRRHLLYDVKTVVRRGSTDTAPEPADPLVARSLKLIRLNLAQHIPITRYAEMLGVGERELERHFQRQTGRSFVATVIRQRLEKARILLAETNEQIKVIAGECGFNSPSHLNKTFHRQFGMTLSEFRRQHR